MDIKPIKSLIINKSLNISLFLLLNLALGAVFAQEGSGAGDRIIKALGCICGVFKVTLPTIAFVLFVLAGVAYAAGNFFGAETRAKAIGYSMNMITGAIIALIFSIIGPTIISSLYGQAVNEAQCSTESCSV